MDTPAGPSLASLFALVDQGAPPSSEALFTALYAELHRMAQRELGRRGWGVSIGATSLLHEAYLELSEKEGARFPDRYRFMAYAARVMRGLIVDYARQKRAQKRGGQFELTAVSPESIQAPAADGDLEHLSEVLDQLARIDPPLAEVVDLKYFCGFSFEDIAAMKSISERTVRRHWTKARAYLHVALRADLERR